MSKIVSVKTADGSITFYNTDVDETYHSKSGAIDEALRKHILPSEILSIENSEIVIGDVCFGLGYNTIVALSEIWKKSPERYVKVIAFENDYTILNKILTLNLPEYLQTVHKKIIELIDSKPIKVTNDFSLHIFDDKKLSISLYVGDVLKTLPKISKETFDVVFFDPFSPKKHSHLWSREMFESVFLAMKFGARLTTYSCARMVRDNMKLAGFIVEDGPSVGRRAPSTIAIKS